MAKKDPHKCEEAYNKWRAKGAPMEGLTQEMYDLTMQFLNDMEIGANVSPSAPKGPRSYIRLLNQRTKMHTWAVILQEELGIKSWDELKDKELEMLRLTKRMRDGEIMGRREKGAPLKAVGTYVKAFKSFWNWYRRVKRKEGIQIPDITVDMDGRDSKPPFNYFTLEQLKKLCDNAKYDYRVMMLFLFDSGLRAPTELMNIKVSDLEWDDRNKIYILHIREEVSKTFGRKIKLMLCSGLLKEYIERENIGLHDYLFTKTHEQMNNYLRKLGYRILGLGQIDEEIGGKKSKYITKGLRLYDFRHCSACYWLPRYKSEAALKYRFGWKKSDMIHYYTDFMGMMDTIETEDLYVDVSKMELEKQMEQKNKEIELLQEQLNEQGQKLQKVMQVIEALELEKEVEASKAN